MFLFRGGYFTEPSGVRNLLGEVREPRGEVREPCGEVREPRGEVREPEPRGEGESRCNFEGEVLVEEVPILRGRYWSKKYHVLNRSLCNHKTEGITAVCNRWFLITGLD